MTEYFQTSLTKQIVSYSALILAILHIANIWMMFQSHIILGVHLGFIFILIFLGKGLPKNKILALTDIVLMLGGVLACAHYSLNYTELAINVNRLTSVDIVLGCLLIIAVLYAAKRTIGTGMTVIALIFMLYVFLEQYIPGAAGHAGFRFSRIISHMYNKPQRRVWLALSHFSYISGNIYFVWHIS